MSMSFPITYRAVPGEVLSTILSNVHPNDSASFTSVAEESSMTSSMSANGVSLGSCILVTSIMLVTQISKYNAFPLSEFDFPCIMVRRLPIIVL